MFKEIFRMNTKTIFTLIILAAFLNAVEPYNRSTAPEHVAKSALGSVEHVIWDGNQISTTHGNHGDIASYHLSSESGLEWPKGSGKTAVFQAGLWMISGKTKAAGSDVWVDELRSAAAEYTVEFTPGSIDGVTNDGHIYEINKKELTFFLENDYATYASSGAYLPVTVLEGAHAFTEDTWRDFPTNDFENWPVAAGAPWVDANGDGLYNIEDGDHPDILGDMFHWYVMNDGDASVHTFLWGTPPMNVELQTSVFGFDQAGALGNILFIRWVVINKGSNDLDSVYVSMWHDDDVGDATDDMVGCNVDLSVGYTYNDITPDANYGVEVPAVGGDFFQGPLVDSPGDTASMLTWSLENSYHIRNVPDKEILGLTSFVKYINGVAAYQDPNTAEQAYLYMNGLIGASGEEYIDPTTGEPSVFVHDGNPVTGTGWLDPVMGDKRYLMTSGPFTMNVGDTVEIVGSIIIAAGSNWKKSITKMFYFDNFAQGAFDANFEVCSPPGPQTEYSQLKDKIILTFEEGSEKIESYNCSGYSFQGYNIYQGKTVAGPWERVATYDIVDGLKGLMDLSLDEETGELLELPSQFGTDSGIQHYIEITDDIINNIKLINHRKYYFAVTAYAYDPDAAQRVIESPQTAITVVPGGPGLGNELASLFSDTLNITHTGLSDAVFLPHVIDPYQLTNHNYTITFDMVDSAYYWYLTDTDDNKLIMSDLLFPATSDYYDYSNSDLTFEDLPSFYENVEITDGFILGARNATFEAPITNSFAETTADDNLDTEIIFGGIKSDGTWASFLTSIPVAQPDAMPIASDLMKDIEFRFTDNGSIGTWFKSNLSVIETVQLPFEMWTVENNQQIDVCVYQVGGQKENIFGLSDDSVSYQINENVFLMPLYRAYTGEQLADYNSTASKIGWMLQLNKDATRFESGNVFTVGFRNPIFPGEDVYSFVGKGLNASDKSSLAAQLELITVFPNPYFGQNPEDSNPQDRKVFFSNLGVGLTTIRVFTIAGDMVTKIEKEILNENDEDRRAEWNLRNNHGIPVASGMYIVHIDVDDSNGRDIGERILKLAVFQPEERLSVY